jgi:hypothetical protein
MGTPNYPKDMGTEWQDMKRNVKNLFTSANYRRALQQIGATGLKVYKSLEMQAGSFMSFKYENGSIGMWLGRHTTGSEDVDGMFIRRADGSIAFWIHSHTVGDGGFTAIYDKNQNIIFSDDGDSGQGIARPWIPYSFVNSTELTSPPAARQTSATTDTALVTAQINVQHPRLRMLAYVLNPGSGTNEVKVKNNTTGETLYSQTYAGLNPGFVDVTMDIGSSNWADMIIVDVTCRRSAGAGAVGITVLGLWGVQS